MRPTQLLHPIWSYSLVTLQFFWITALLVLMGLPESKLSILIHLLGVVLGLWAIKTMHLGHFNIVPDPMPEINLVTTGPYQYIRHPMYGSILLFFLPALSFSNDWQVWSSYGALCITLLIKLSYEEHLLEKSHIDYPAYQQKTARLLPKIY